MKYGAFEVADAFGFFAESFRVEQLALKDLRRIRQSLIVGATAPSGTIGSVHLGLNQSISISEGNQPIRAVAPYAVCFETVWLPDPLYSFFVPAAGRLWHMLPDSGSPVFSAKGAPHIDWKQLWDYPAGQRLDAARSRLPGIIARLRELRPLHDVGAIRLYAWEALVAPRIQELVDTTKALLSHPLTTAITQRFLQDQYNLGPRVGAIGIRMQAGLGLPPGTPLFFADKSPIIFYGLLQASLAPELGASLIPSLPGDRVVYDFVITGNTAPATRPIAGPLELPGFGAAVLPDLVALRKDVRALADIRAIVTQAASLPEKSIETDLRLRLEQAAADLRGDSSVVRAVGGAVTRFVLGSLMGSGANALANAQPAVAAGVAGATPALVLELAQLIFGERSRLRRSSELVARIAERL